MEHYGWSNKKNEQLKTERGVCFEQVVLQIDSGNLKAVYEYPNKEQYPGQSILVVEINRYCYLVSYVENDNGKFLKTIIPSRKATRMYMGE